MKRTCRILLILTLVILTVTLSVGMAFADGTEETGEVSGGLNLVDSYPKDGATGAAIENFDVKLYFDGKLTKEVLGSKNDKCFKITDADGTELPLLVLYDPKNHDVMMILFDYNTEKTDADGKPLRVKGDTEYTLTISGDLMADNGDTLGQDQTITFKTINQTRNSAISMFMMLILYAGIIFFTMRNSKKKAEENKANGYDPVNPYKEAKRTGKSVEEIVEKENRKKEKAAIKAARAAEEDEDDDDDYEPYVPEGHYRVKTLRTVASGGSTYITGRRAAAEERAAREARYARNAKKGKKGKKK